MRTDLLAQLAALGIRPRKGLGQNFLVDPSHRARIVDAAQLSKDDAVLEIGPGPGVLTELIAEQAGRVVAVELDERLVPLLSTRFAGQPHVTIIHADIMDEDPGALMGAAAYKVVANLPYYITSAVIRRLLEFFATISANNKTISCVDTSRTPSPPHTHRMSAIFTNNFQAKSNAPLQPP